VRDADVHAPEVPQLVLRGTAGNPSREVERHVRQMQQDRHRVDENQVGDHARRAGVGEEVCRDDGAVAVRREDDAIVAVEFENLCDLGAERGGGERGVGYSEADRMDLERDDANALVGEQVGVDVAQEVDVGVEPDTDAVDEEDGEVGARGV